MSTTQFTGLITALTRQRGVLGCLVVSERDGIIVDADVQAGVDAAAVAALAAALYRRDAFLSLGGFDEDFFCYLEDVDLGFRLRLAGQPCRYVPQAIINHQGSASTGLR